MTCGPQPVPTLREVAGRLRAALPALAFAVEYGVDFGAEPGNLHEWDIGQADVRIGPWSEILDGPAAKLLARQSVPDQGAARTPVPRDDLAGRAAEVIGDLATVTHSSDAGLLEISAPGVSKATTLANLAAGENILAAEVVAFGDMPNDMPMLGWAGLSVAVANAHPDVLAAADEITASNDRFGVALVLERLFSAQPPSTVPAPRRPDAAAV